MGFVRPTLSRRRNVCVIPKSARAGAELVLVAPADGLLHRGRLVAVRLVLLLLPRLPEGLLGLLEGQQVRLLLVVFVVGLCLREVRDRLSVDGPGRGAWAAGSGQRGREVRRRRSAAGRGSQREAGDAAEGGIGGAGEGCRALPIREAKSVFSGSGSTSSTHPLLVAALSSFRAWSAALRVRLIITSDLSSSSICTLNARPFFCQVHRAERWVGGEERMGAGTARCEGDVGGCGAAPAEEARNVFVAVGINQRGGAVGLRRASAAGCAAPSSSSSSSSSS